MSDGLIPLEFRRVLYSSISQKLRRGELDKLVSEIAKNGGRITKDTRGLLLEGSNGIGKTYIACALARLFQRRGWIVKPPVFTSISFIMDNWNEEDVWRGKSWKDTFIYTPFLILDDLGKEDLANEYMVSKIVSKLGYLLRSRLQNNRYTVITTNLDENGIKRIYGDSMHSILHEIATHWIILTGPDRRIGK